MPSFIRCAGAALVVLLGSLSAAAQAQNLRCKNDFVQPGDSKLSVIEKCGEPVLQDSFCKPLPAASEPRPVVTQGNVLNVRPCERLDEWSYKPGAGQFITILQFEQGKVSSIRYGSRIP
ncbi:MAG: hypothetical protein RLZZ618_1787 [Pseudomonadota bacterium]|jgi:hypothetical protein